MFRSLLLLSLFVTSAHAEEELKTVTKVDINRYMGTWHEIARLPNKHQDKCIKTQAVYTMENKDEISLKNSCSLADGTTKEVKGIGRIKDSVTMAKLEVNFVPRWLRWIGLGWGNYWIIELEPNYHYVVVSEPKREYLWILSRAEKMEKSVYEGIVNRLKNNNFDVSKLILSGELF